MSDRYELILQFDAEDSVEATEFAKQLRTCTDLPPWLDGEVRQISLRKITEGP